MAISAIRPRTSPSSSIWAAASRRCSAANCRRTRPCVPTSVEGLFAVTGGSCDYAAITALSRPELSRLLKHFRESFDHIIIDAGPTLAFSDAAAVRPAERCGHRGDDAGCEPRALVNTAIERLRSVGVRVIGTVVNGVADASPRRLYASPLPA